MRLADLTIAIRNLARRPGFACTAILLLALGSGANAAVFSRRARCAAEALAIRAAGRVGGLLARVVRVERGNRLLARARAVSRIDLGISPGWMMALVADGVEPLKVTAGRVGDNFFSTLGVRAVLGRLQPGDSSRDRSRVAVISSELHRASLRSDPRILGRSIRLDNVVHEIVGVMPRGFVHGARHRRLGTARVRSDVSSARASFNRAVARLAPGVRGARVAGTPGAHPRHAPRPRQDRASGGGDHVRLLQDSVANDVRLTLLILLGAVGMVLLMAAVNLGTLAMGRSIARPRNGRAHRAWRLARSPHPPVDRRAHRPRRRRRDRRVAPRLDGAAAPHPGFRRRCRAERSRWTCLVPRLVFAASVGVSALLALVPASSRHGLSSSRSSDSSRAAKPRRDAERWARWSPHRSHSRSSSALAQASSA